MEGHQNFEERIDTAAPMERIIRHLDGGSVI